MGCDFFYSGSLPEEELQEKIVRFLCSYHTTIDLRITPDRRSRYRTRLGRSLRSRVAMYPFDFFGVIPHIHDGILEHGQFVFDRAAGGRLVRLLKLPDSFTVAPNELETDTDDVDVVVKEGGYNRELGGDSFALLLNVIKLRWWPELDAGDDYNLCDVIGNMIWEYALARRMKNEGIDFDACFRLLSDEHEKRHPKRPSPPAELKSIVRLVDPAALDTRIDDLELSVRTHHCLSDLGIETVGELMRHTVGDLLKHRNLGRKSIHELQGVLDELGVHLKEE